MRPIAGETIRPTLSRLLLTSLLAGAWGCRGSDNNPALVQADATAVDLDAAGRADGKPEGGADVTSAEVGGDDRGDDGAMTAPPFADGAALGDGRSDVAAVVDGGPGELADAAAVMDAATDLAGNPAADGPLPDTAPRADGPAADGPGGQAACPAGMVLIPARNQSFMMGFSAAEAGTEWACFIGKHKVTFTSDFCMDATLVRQQDYLKLMGNNPSTHRTADLTMPVDAVTWYDAILYCNERSKLEGLQPVYSYASLTRAGNHVTAMVGVSYDIKKNGYRLPTNAEYEFAERATLTADYLYIYSKTATIDINTATGPADAYSWNVYNAGNTTHPVGLKKPNLWGLYDIVGNLFEWENDWEGPYLLTDQVDPLGPANGDTPCGTDNTATPKRMGKGGSYGQDPKNHGRISYHYKFFPWTIGSQLGFRAVSTVQ